MLPGPDGQAERTPMASSRAGPQVIDQARFDGLGDVLYGLTREIRHELQRTPDSGDLLLALAGAPDTLAGQALRELGTDLGGLPDLVDARDPKADRNPESADDPSRPPPQPT